MLGKLLFAAALVACVQARAHSVLDHHCPPLGHSFQHFLLPHEDDCAKFYYCEDGYRRIEATSCPLGTVFATSHRACIHPSEANCKLPLNQNGVGSGDNENAQSVLDSKCPPLGHPFQHFLLPHEDDCAKFYYCEDGYRRIEPSSCPLGTVFSFMHAVCLNPSEVNCQLPYNQNGAGSGNNDAA